MASKLPNDPHPADPISAPRPGAAVAAQAAPEPKAIRSEVLVTLHLCLRPGSRNLSGTVTAPEIAVAPTGSILDLDDVSFARLSAMGAVRRAGEEI